MNKDPFEKVVSSLCQNTPIAEKNKFQAVFDYALDTIAILNDAGQYIDVNPSFCQMVELPKSEIIGKTPADIFSFEPDMDFSKRWKILLERGYEKGTIVGALHNGKVLWREYQIAANILPGCHLSIARDITDRKLAEETLIQSFEKECLIRRLVTTISNSFDVDFILKYAAEEIGSFFKVDRCLIYRFEYDEDMQRFCYRLTGQYRSGEDISIAKEEENEAFSRRNKSRTANLDNANKVIKTTTPEEYLQYLKSYIQELDIPMDNPDKLLKEHIESLQIKSSMGLEIHYKKSLYGGIALYQCKNAREWTDEEENLLQDLATHIGAAIYQADLFHYEQKAKEFAELVNGRKDLFLTNMSHELRTPLHAIIGFSEMMKSGFAGSLTNKQEQYVYNIVKSGYHLLELVNDILDISKIEAGRIELRIETVKLIPLLDDIRHILGEIAKQHKVSIDYDINDDIKEIQADPARLKQILYNLVSNAIKFNRENGEVSIQFSLSSNKRWVICEVSDTGIGIPAKEVPSLFTRFHQIDNELTRSKDGTGLGLALVKGLVELHGGYISVKTEEGKGSIFKFRIPTMISSK